MRGVCRDLEEFRKLPIDEQVRQMFEWGTIDETGEVLLGRKKDKEPPATTQKNGR